MSTLSTGETDRGIQIPESVAAKLDRAAEHIAAAKAATAAFLETGPFRLGRTLEDDGARHVYRFARYDPTPSALSVVIGDAVHNLRSALDHIAFNICLRRKGAALTEDEERFIAFPCATSEVAWNNALGKGSLEYAPPHAVGYIRSLQPFNWPDHTHAILYSLTRLDNLDKHRYLNTVASRIPIPDPPLPPGVPPYTKDLSDDGTWGLGSHVVTYIFPTAQPDLVLDVHRDSTAALEEAWPPMDVGKFLDDCLEFIQMAVVLGLIEYLADL